MAQLASMGMLGDGSELARLWVLVAMPAGWRALLAAALGSELKWVARRSYWQGLPFSGACP